MKVKIIYFSGTGNTQLISEKIKHYIKSQNKTIELIKAEHYIKNYLAEFPPDNVSLLGIGFPVYDLLAPKIINDIIETLPKRKTPLPVFLFSTESFIKGDCLNIVARALRNKGYLTILQ